MNSDYCFCIPMTLQFCIHALISHLMLQLNLEQIMKVNVRNQIITILQICIIIDNYSLIYLGFLVASEIKYKRLTVSWLGKVSSS